MSTSPKLPFSNSGAFAVIAPCASGQYLANNGHGFMCATPPGTPVIVRPVIVKSSWIGFAGGLSVGLMLATLVAIGWLHSLRKFRS